MTNIDHSRTELLSDAATHLRVAIDLLDRACAPGQISARVDHALCEIDDLLPVDGGLNSGVGMQLGASTRPR